MRILIVCIHYPVASGRYIARALQRLGHEVRTLGPTTGVEVWGMKVKEEHAWQPDFGEITPELDAWNPELVITADSAYSLAGDLGRPHVVWGVDNHARDYRFEGAKIDAYFLAHSWGARMKEPNVYWLPCAYDPEAHVDVGLEREVDVMMVGVAYESRVDILQRMNRAGLNAVGITGALWGDYNTLYNQAKIALVKSAGGDLAQRFFENMAQGCCVLTDHVVDAGNLGFLPGVDYWPYSDAGDAAHQAKWLLKSGRWKDIAANGQRKVKAELPNSDIGMHTWDARALQMLSVVTSPLPLSEAERGNTQVDLEPIGAVR